MTKQLLPGLGSGALREALEQAVDALERIRASQRIVGALVVQDMEGAIRDGRAALSLSSPIEPAGDTLWQHCLSLVERCRQKTPDKWDFAHELAEICKKYAAPSRQGAGGK